MKASQTETLRSFRRVRQFIAENTPANAPASFGRQLTELDDVLAQLDRIGLDQEAGGRTTNAETRHQRELRITLLKQHLQPISRVAREVFGATGVDRALRMPRSRKNEAILAAARAMAEAAEKEQERFVEHGLSADFIAQLRVAATALGGAMSARVGSQHRKVQATAAVHLQMKRGKRAVRLLDAVIVPSLRANADKLAAWQSARRVKAAPVAGQTDGALELVPKVA